MEIFVATTFMTPLAVLVFTGAVTFLIQEIVKTSYGGTIEATEIEDLTWRLAVFLYVAVAFCSRFYHAKAILAPPPWRGPPPTDNSPE